MNLNQRIFENRFPYLKHTLSYFFVQGCGLMSCMSPFSGDRRWVPRVPKVKECFHEFSPQVRFRFEANDRNRIILNLEISVQMAFFVYQNSMGIFNWKNHHADSMDSGWVRLRFRLFWTILAQALNEMWPIEVLGLFSHWIFACLFLFFIFFPNSRITVSVFCAGLLVQKKVGDKAGIGAKIFQDRWDMSVSLGRILTTWYGQMSLTHSTLKHLSAEPGMGEFQLSYSAFWSRQGPGVVFLYFSVVISKNRFCFDSFWGLGKAHGCLGAKCFDPQGTTGARDTTLWSLGPSCYAWEPRFELVPSGSHLL